MTGRSAGTFSSHAGGSCHRDNTKIINQTLPDPVPILQCTELDTRTGEWVRRRHRARASGATLRGPQHGSVFMGLAGCTRLWSVLEPESKVLVTVNLVMPSLLAPS